MPNKNTESNENKSAELGSGQSANMPTHFESNENNKSALPKGIDSHNVLSPIKTFQKFWILLRNIIKERDRESLIQNYLLSLKEITMANSIEFYFEADSEKIVDGADSVEKVKNSISFNHFQVNSNKAGDAYEVISSNREKVFSGVVLEKYYDFFERGKLKIISDQSSDEFIASVHQGGEVKVLIAPITSGESYYGFLKIGYCTDTIENIDVLSEGITTTLLALARAYDSQKMLNDFTLLSEFVNAEMEYNKKISSKLRHDLKTPLNAIFGFTHLLKSTIQPSEDTQDSFRAINNNAELMLEMIDEFAPFGSEPKVKKINLSEFRLSEIADKLESYYIDLLTHKKIKFIIPNRDELTTLIRADKEKIIALVRLLFENAIDAQKEGNLVFRLNYSNKSLKLSVTDTGRGIEPKLVKKINTFLIAKDLFASRTFISSVGLNEIRKIANMLEAAIRYESEVEKGTTVTVILAATQIEEVSFKGSAKTGKIVGYTGAKKKILVVDDKHENRFVLMRLLKYAGFEVLDASTGLTALEKVATFNPDLIFMDLFMPDLNGYESALRIREDRENDKIKLIASTGAETEKIGTKFDLSIFDDILSKPYKTEDVFLILENNLGLTWLTEEKKPIPTKARPLEYTDDRFEIIPIPEIIQRLEEYAALGNIKAILKELDILLQDKIDYSKFVNYFKKLSLSFDLKNLRSELKKYSGRNDE